MARACFFVLFVSFIIACDFSSAFLIRGKNLEALFANDAPAPQDVVEEVGLETAPGDEIGLETDPVEEIGLETAPVEEIGLETAPVEVLLTKKCAKIGEFCMNHSDCCTNACLGYMKRCVS